MKKNYTNCNKPRWAEWNFLRPFFFSFLLAMVFGNAAIAQFDPADCPTGLNCTSNDVRIIRAYLSGPDDAAIDCNAEKPFENAVLHLIVSSNTQRIGVSISTNLVAGSVSNPLGKCFGVRLNNGSNNNLEFDLGTTLSNVKCGTSFSLTNVFTSWGTGNTNFCDGDGAQCPATPAKCRYKAGEIIKVDVKLDVDFTFKAGDCSKSENGLKVDFTPSVTAKNIAYPLTFDWEFGDGQTAQTTATDAADVANAGTDHTYANANNSPYTVKLTVTDATTETPVVKSTQYEVAVQSCCNLPAPLVSGGTFCSSEGKKLSDLNPDPDGGYFSWFDGADPATSFEVDPNTVIPVGTNKYWISYSKDGCESGRTEVTITVKANSAPPEVSNVSYCKDETASALTATGSGLLWYTDETGGTGSTTAPTPSTATVGSVDYYVSQTVEGECESARAKITVTVKSLPSLTVQNLTNVCPAKTVNLANAITGGSDPVVYYRVGNNTPLTSAQVAAAGAGNYSIVMTNASTLCSKTATVTVTIITCQGCTPGYWKNRKETWNTVRSSQPNGVINCVYAAGDLGLVPNPAPELKNRNFYFVFGINYPVQNQTPEREARTGKGTASLSLLGAVGLGDGSGYTQLARAATAALLNSCALTGVGAYPYSSASIIADTRTVFLASISAASRQAALDLAKKYDIANNNVCTIDNSTKSAVNVMGARETHELHAITVLSVNAAPNPFTDKIRFTIQAPKAGRASLEVYNMLGQKVGIPFEGQLNAGETRNVEYTAPANTRSGLIYMLRMNGEQVSGKLMSTKQ
jgi:hypothetical protein